MVLSIVVKMAVKDVNINSKVRRVIVIIVVIEVGGTFALVVATLIVDIIAPCCTRFYTTRLYTTSKAIGKGIIVYKYNYILGSFNWY